MKNVMGVIFASDNETKLTDLTVHRTTASLPFCGRYRLIDFSLSNFVNNGIDKIALVTRSNYSSLMDHIRMGRDWDLNRKNDGISVFPPFVLNSSREMYKGKIEALYSIQGFIRAGREEYVLMSNGNIAMNIDLEQVFQSHLKTGADVTMLTHKEKVSNIRRLVVETDNDNRVVDMYLSETAQSDEKEVGLNVYFIKKAKLLGLVDYAYARGYFDFEKDILTKRANELKIYSYHVTEYAAIVDDIKSFYHENMNLLDSENRRKLFYGHGVIHTKVKDSVPTLYKEDAQVTNSLIADGCIINGKVENSILSRGVVVEKGAVVSNCIIMENCQIKENATVNYVITDKHVTINSGRVISGYETYPLVIAKGKKV